ncbi:MAG: ferrous iron transport protein A [candidate division WOR-3 bacterium]|nr:MAG: ferrous iron transport protein A [candidate division WOR-3 bacterium]
MSAIPLTNMESGKKGKVIEIQGGRGLIARLSAMGVRPGIKITKISGQIMRGPVIVRVGNTQIAIGFGMASRVIVEV